jgi:hypothetical protein
MELLNVNVLVLSWTVIVMKTVFVIVNVLENMTQLSSVGGNGLMI